MPSLHRKFHIGYCKPNKTNLDQNITSGEIGVKKVDLKNIVSMRNESIPYNASFGEDVDAKLPTLGITYKKQKDCSLVHLSNN